MWSFAVDKGGAFQRFRVLGPGSRAHYTSMYGMSSGLVCSRRHSKKAKPEHSWNGCGYLSGLLAVQVPVLECSMAVPSS
jgi:hypothetical protein